MSYLVGIGHDVALGSLVAIAPQPKSTGVQATRRNQNADGSISEDGLYVILEFTALGSASVYQSVLGQFNLMTNDSANVTIYARNSRWVFARYNATAVYPEMGRDASWDYFPRNISIVVHSLELLV